MITTEPITSARATLPSPAPCPDWCTVPEHREPDWTEQDINRFGASRTCTQVIGGVNWTVPGTTHTESASVRVERYQAVDRVEFRTDDHQVYPAAVRILGADDEPMPVTAVRFLSRLLAIAADRAEVTR